MRKIRIKYRKLGQHKAFGLAHSDGVVEIDARLKGKKKLEIIIHESLHILFPEKEEEEIVEKSVILCNTLWHQLYRQIDNTKEMPMQDGSK